MNAEMKAIAEKCSHASEADAMTFPEIVKTLMDAGFESYLIDFRRGVKTFYAPGGESFELASSAIAATVVPTFDAAKVNQAVREAQQKAPGYTYMGFCAKIAGAGCAGYLVSFSGQRALYFGRTAETHVEHFPQSPSKH